MVITRAQARRERGSDADNASNTSADDIHEVSSDEARESNTPMRGSGGAKSNYNINSSTAKRSASSSGTARGGATVDKSSSSGEVEKLGRGCRVSRSSITLDEQYLAASLYRSSAQSRGLAGVDRYGGRHHSRGRATDTHEEAFTINRRYPMREAAKRAMENLHVTLTSANGAAGLDGNSDEDKSNSNSMGIFHFRNHPELGEEITKKRERQKKWGRGRRRRGRPQTSTDESSFESSDNSADNSNGSSGSDSANSSDSDQANHTFSSVINDNTVGLKHTSAAAVCQGNSTSSPHMSDGVGTVDKKYNNRPPQRRSTTTAYHSHNDDVVSLDSSITEASMREESVERMAMQDRHANAEILPSSASSDNNDGTRDFATDVERKRALRNARESTSQNVNLNYYMPDAVGAADARKIRRRQLDRRYRWLVYQEEEARVRGDGSGIGNNSGGGLGGTGGDSSGSAVTTANGALGDILPLRVDDGVTFDSVGGLPEHIVTLREMVLLPLLYPDLFERLDLKAPRGVLFVGPPGTGKTLMARALANEGSRFACGGVSSPTSGKAPSQPQRITFFVRKGADMLSKWVGESERQLKLLFEEAKRLQPSIIFFDEVDGLAPMRHAKTEQTQAALVSTLLALMDGLEDRGQVVVIGATNRPDTLDPALRRPGRFDRELVFPLPDAAARRHILTIQLAKKAMPDSAEQRTALLNDLVEMTEGYSGADLSALCMEASLHRLRTALPQLYLSSKRLIVPREIEQAQLHVRTEDFYAAAQLMQPSLRRCRMARQTDSCFLDAYVEILVRGTRNATLAALAPSWSLVDKVLRASSRDCQDMATAVRALCAVPIPRPPRPCLLVLREASPTVTVSATPTSDPQQQQRRALQLHHLSISLLKGLPGLRQITVNLPALIWESDISGTDGAAAASAVLHARGFSAVDYSGMSEDYLAGSSNGAGGCGVDGFGHMSQVVQSVRQCSPCVVYLSGAEEWLSSLHEKEEADKDDNDEGERNEAEDQRAMVAQNERNTDGRNGATSVTAIPTVFTSRRQQRRVQLFRYYMNMLADTDVIFLLPCATAATCALLLGINPQTHPQVEKPQSFPDTPASLIGHSMASSELYSIGSASPSSPMLTADPPTAVHLTRVPPHQQLLHPQFSIVHAVIATTPLPTDLRRFVEFIHRIVTMTLLLHRNNGGGDCGAKHFANAVNNNANDGNTNDAFVNGSDETVRPDGGVLVLQQDDAPLPSPLANAQLRARRRADRARRCDVWRKVEYRRLQLRHVLMKWVSQYINSAKFKLLASADLDFASDDPLYKAWRQHTKHHRIGLQDILENIEDERYVCLSQYHDDIDQLVRNVRSFFRTRAAQDQRYRLKALDLKETCLLNMYKMNREVIRFCEQTREMQEPSSSSDDNEDENDDAYWRSGGKLSEGGDSQRHHKHRRAEQIRDRGGQNNSGHHRTDPLTSLLRKEDDPALMAEQSRRAVSFSQRPAAPPRKRRRSGWMYGDHRRRRRKRTPAAKKQPEAATSKEQEREKRRQENAENVGPEMEDEEAAEVDVYVHVSSNSESEEHSSLSEKRVSKGAGKEDRKNTETHEAQEEEGTASSQAAANPDDTVEEWACALLSSFTYTRLYHVFKSIMRGLEVEVLLLNGREAQQHQRQQEQQQPSMSSENPAEGVEGAEAGVEQNGATSEATPTTPESSVTSVFKKLLLAAVVE